MNPIQQELKKVWDQLRSQKPSRANHLEEVRIQKMRGIQDLRVPFSYPVSVLAGANGSGKSTVLFALACAYDVPGAKPRDFTPATLFPGYHPSKGIGDSREDSTLIFSYVADNQRFPMQWKRGAKQWNKSAFGRKGQKKLPSRKLYLRTLANLTNPSEVRSILQIAHRSPKVSHVDAATIGVAERILGFRYANLERLSAGVKELLFARREDGKYYSEFHMSSGERALLRLSLEISQIEDALVLIDEVETGLHPYIQQMLMLELQRLALRNRLQIVVTTHSPVVLDSVPHEARLFLDRDGDVVRLREPYKDIIQKSLYGQAQNKISLLCEDEVAEAVVRGVLEHEGPEMNLFQGDIEVGRDTGKDQYLNHLETLARFKRLHDVIFILDGDGADIRLKLEARAEKYGQSARVLVLPGDGPPESWCWECLKTKADHYAAKERLNYPDLPKKLQELENLYATASDKPAEIAKARFASLAADLSRSAADLARQIGREEARSRSGRMQEFVIGLKDAIQAWRNPGS
jgi:predicted ATPase